MDSTLAGVHYDLGLLYLFSPSVPGASGRTISSRRRFRSSQTFKSMRGAKALKGPGDDVDELLSTAKRKQSELQLKAQAAAASASAAPAPARSSSSSSSSRAGGRLRGAGESGRSGKQ